jgi:manganese/iron transport system permease protein
MAELFNNIWNWLLEPFNSLYAGALVRNALWELLIISVIGGVVGTYIVLRGLVFIVDALTHAIFPGVVIAFLIGVNFFLGAFISALAVALVIALVARNRRVSEDSSIGVIFTGAFALGVVLLSSQRSYGRSLEGLLFGDILGITATDLWVTGIVGVLILGAIFATRKELLFSSFDAAMARASGLPVVRLDLFLYLIIAATVVVSLPAVGNILVLAFLVTPSATARLFTNRFYRMMPLAVLLGMLASITGLYLGYYANVAGSAGVVVVATGFFIIGLIISPNYGLFVQLRQRRLWKQRLRQESREAQA